MNITYLNSFIKTVKQDSISKAAKNLHMTQSALSQQLQALEKSLNAKLLIRSNKGVNLTDEGEIVLSYAEALVNLYENMAKELDQCKKSELEEIKISACNSVGEYLLPCTLHLYKKNHKNVRFSLKTEHSKNVLQNVLDCSSDVGFIDIDSDRKIEGIESFNICSNNLIFIFSSKFNIEKTSITLEEIAELPLIIGSDRSSLRGIIEKLFTSNKISVCNLNIEMELDTLESIKASVIADHGVSIVPYTSVKKEIHTKALKTLPIKDAAPSCNISMVYQKSRANQPHIKSFISYIKKYGRETFC
ncbi:LysR family transcriptional regulator [Clostridium swellfunianum]|uniref:LysR family transcriptional regulator n=1 Tax=Clostridium swellfunianum TaxID=1367462 RepID=UPI00202E230A|nr:LysR family transcriptional regulator [Clostridium swellfunianum]MCM0648223.1 LysR family transcriptional regulator [Clostridium swellfunianum]